MPVVRIEFQSTEDLQKAKSVIIHHSTNGKPAFLAAERSFRLIRCFNCLRIGHTTLLQPYAQHTRIYSNIREINCSSKQHLRMKFLSINCRSWNTAKDSVKSIVLNYNLDSVCLSETWEKDNKPLQFGSWPIISKPRINNSGHGGVAII